MVSRVAQSLDRAVAAFYARSLDGRYQALMLHDVGSPARPERG